MTKELITQADIPTHRLSIMVDKDHFKTFFVSEKQAEMLWEGINGKDNFICLSKDVDKDAPSFYPKFGARLERLSKEEIRSRQEAYDRSLKTHVEEKVEQKKKFDSEKVDGWIAANPDAWEDRKKAAFEKLSKSTMFLGATDIVQGVLVRMDARRILHEDITKPTP